jgi:L-iditol 2-dehydrogenase
MSMNKSMNACVLHAVGDLRYEQVPLPQRKPDEVLINIKASGICGSDVPRVFEKGTYRFPTIPGHEFAGVVVEADSLDLVGSRAAVFPLLPCKKCASCRAEEYAQCTQYNYFGSRCNGGFAETIAVPLWNLVPVPDTVTMEEAAMCEPAAVAHHAVMVGGISTGDTVAIFGAGPIGLILGQWAKAFGASLVVLADIDAYKVDFAKKFGFAHAINSRETDVLEYIKQVTGGHGVDVCIEGAGATASLEQCMGAAKTFGKVVLMGNPTGEMKLSQKGYWEILRKQLTLKGTWNSSYGSQANDWYEAIKAMSDGRLNLKPLISHRFTLSQCHEAFEVMRRRDGWFSKVMFTIV